MNQLSDGDTWSTLYTPYLHLYTSAIQPNCRLQSASTWIAKTPASELRQGRTASARLVELYGPSAVHNFRIFPLTTSCREAPTTAGHTAQVPLLVYTSEAADFDDLVHGTRARGSSSDGRLATIHGRVDLAGHVTSMR